MLSDIDPPKTHDLQELRGELPTDWIVKRRPADLTRLSRFGVVVRYPDRRPRRRRRPSAPDP